MLLVAFADYRLHHTYLAPFFTPMDYLVCSILCLIGSTKTANTCPFMKWWCKENQLTPIVCSLNKAFMLNFVWFFNRHFISNFLLIVTSINWFLFQTDIFRKWWELWHKIRSHRPVCLDGLSQEAVTHCLGLKRPPLSPFLISTSGKDDSRSQAG